MALQMLAGYSLPGAVLNRPEESFPAKTTVGRKEESLKIAIVLAESRKPNTEQCGGFLAGVPGCCRGGSSRGEGRRSWGAPGSG